MIVFFTFFIAETIFGLSNSSCLNKASSPVSLLRAYAIPSIVTLTAFHLISCLLTSPIESLSSSLIDGVKANLSGSPLENVKHCYPSLFSPDV